MSALPTARPTERAPFPYFGGKAPASKLVWDRFGAVRNYVEPFFGSGAVLLNRPGEPDGVETVNDACGFVANFWRAVQADPESVAKWADNPVVENDLHARHAWLVARADDLTARLEGDPDYHDPKIAGWWAWGACCWIGSGWCSGKGPWAVQDGKLVKGGSGRGVKRALPHLGDSGQGVNRKRPHLGCSGRGVNRSRPHLGGSGQGVNRPAVDRLEFIQDWMGRLSARLRASQFRVCCGDWTRVMGPVVLTAQKPCAVFLDPPYSADANRDMRLYRKESGDVARAVQEWAIAHGDDPRLRIALCGFAGEHAMPADWESVSWIYRGGYGNQNRGGYANANRERIWFSPHCLRPTESARMFY